MKPKQPTKPRAKGTTKTKADALQAQPTTETVSYTGSGRMTKPPGVLSLPVTNLNSSAVGAAAARSRSQSTMPVACETLDEKEVEKDETDDKVYCICKTEYEEGKVMIACDRFVTPPTPRSRSVTLTVVGFQV
jgi:COMPASS component SPP1